MLVEMILVQILLFLVEREDSTDKILQELMILLDSLSKYCNLKNLKIKLDLKDIL